MGDNARIIYNNKMTLYLYSLITLFLSAALYKIVCNILEKKYILHNHVDTAAIPINGNIKIFAG